MSLIEVGAKKIGIINVYLPPYSRSVPVNEIGKLLRFISKLCKEIIMIGDMNQPGILWTENDELLWTMLNSSTHSSKIEQDFIKILNNNALYQINHIVNSRGAILDLICTTHFPNKEVRCATSEEQLDSPSIHHEPLVLECKWDHTDTYDNTAIRKISRFDMNAIKTQLSNSTFAEFSVEHELSAMGEYDDRIVNSTQLFTETIQNIIEAHSYEEKAKSHNNHPWLRGSKAYTKLKKFTHKLYRQWKNASTPETHLAYRLSANQLQSTYNLLRQRYYSALICEANDGNPRHLYAVHRFKSRPSLSLPSIMHYKGNHYRNELVAGAFEAHFKANFAMNNRSFAIPIMTYTRSTPNITPIKMKCYGRDTCTNLRLRIFIKPSVHWPSEKIQVHMESLHPLFDTVLMKLHPNCTKFSTQCLEPVICQLIGKFLILFQSPNPAIRRTSQTIGAFQSHQSSLSFLTSF